MSVVEDVMTDKVGWVVALVTDLEVADIGVGKDSIGGVTHPINKNMHNENNTNIRGHVGDLFSNIFR